MGTDSVQRALELRKTVVVDGKVLVAEFQNTLQGADTSRVIDLMPVVDSSGRSTERYPFRAKVNVKEIDPIAAAEYKKPFFDIRDKSDAEIEKFINSTEFDFPLWFKKRPGFKMQEVQSYNPPFILQVAACNFHDGSSQGGCWYCFVDDESNDGIPKKGKMRLGIEETVDSFIAARGKVRDFYSAAGYAPFDMKVIRSSGGEPTLALDWILNMWREIGKRGIDVVGQLDSNLSTGRVVEDFERRGVYEPQILEKLAQFPVKVLTAIKGTDQQNLSDNVQSNPSLEDQEHSIIRFVKSGFEIFPQMYNANPATLKAFLERMDKVIENFSLRIHVGPLKVYGPNAHRLATKAALLGINPKAYIEAQKKEWDYNFQRGCEILEGHLQSRFGVGYKQVSRADIPLKVR
ncbi:MAG: hypothetical protein WCK90_02800 [archaeon]